jgi:hypothetical protein
MNPQEVHMPKNDVRDLTSYGTDIWPLVRIDCNTTTDRLFHFLRIFTRRKGFVFSVDNLKGRKAQGFRKNYLIS